MTLWVVLGCIWVLAATAIALMPRHMHWPGAVALIVTGIPLVGMITWQSGPLLGGLALVAGASILRWPLIHLGRWLRQVLGRTG